MSQDGDFAHRKHGMHKPPSAPSDFSESIDLSEGIFMKCMSFLQKEFCPGCWILGI